MSGITGIFYRNGQDIDPALIKKMNNKISHRGPDGSAVWFEGSIALGHQMLYTTQESLKENLPFHDEKTRLTITADARIDNRTELSEKLNIKDTSDVSDSYFILKSYEKWGENCPEYLLGDFAFVIWNDNENKVFCARDHAGIRPFYYYISDEIFAFASEIKSLFCISKIPHNINEFRIALHLIPNQDKQMSFYEKILRLPAANSMIISNQNFNTKEYWELDPNLEIKLDSDEEYVKKFLEIFTECIKCRLRSHFPIGFELSGGLDSSSIVCATKKILNDNNQFSDINTFSRTYKNIPKSDESYFINEVVNLGGIKPHFFNADQIPLLSQMDEVLSFYDEPIDVPIIAHTWSFYKKIQNEKIRVLFRGLGGDSTLFVFPSFNYLKELAITFHWIKLYKETKNYSKKYNETQFKVIKNLISLLIPSSIKRIIGFINNTKERSSYDVLNKELVERLNIKASIITTTSRGSNPKQIHYSMICLPGHQNSLESVNQLSSAFSIETVCPYYDKRLIEFCYAIPSTQKFKNGLGRMIIRRAMKNVLPEKVRLRYSKSTYGSVIEKNFSSFKEEYMNNLSDEIIKDFVDMEYIHKLSKKDKLLAWDMPDIMRVIFLKLWLEKNEKN